MIFAVKRFAIHDGPGIRTTFFLKGCPLNCLWCHNPEGLSYGAEIFFNARRCISCGCCNEVCPAELVPENCQACGRCVEACPTGARESVERAMSVPECLSIVESDTPFYEESGGGVTVSGGEPLTHLGFLEKFLTEVKKLDIHTALDTSLYAPRRVLLPLLPLVDLWLVDLKVMDSAKHEEFTGVTNKPVLANLQTLIASDANVAIRMPVVPGVNDDVENCEALGAFLQELGITEIKLLPYHSDGDKQKRLLPSREARPEFTPPSEKTLQEIATCLAKYGVSVDGE